MQTERLWYLSVRAYSRGWVRAAKLIKALNFLLNHTLLPYQAELGEGVVVEHHGLGVVIHPNTTLGRRVKLWHSVTLAAETRPGSPHRIVVEDNVVIGAGAIVIARHDQGLRIGRGAQIGAGAVVTRDVAAGAKVTGPAATARKRGPSADQQ